MTRLVILGYSINVASVLPWIVTRLMLTYVTKIEVKG